MDDLTLIQTNNKGLQQLIKYKMTPNTVCGGFINVSDAWNGYQKKSTASNPQNFLKTYLMPAQSKSITKNTYPINHPKEVAQLYSLLTPSNMQATLKALSSFHDRYANSDNGVESAEWVKYQIESMVALYQRKDITVVYVPTKGYKQPSIVVKIGNDTTTPGIVVGSHMDSVESVSNQPMPAADDDGSGTVTLLEAFRTTLESGMTFNKPVYFIWYAAEEDGLIGSQNVVKYFVKNKMPVELVFNMDMTGYAYDGDRTIYLINDFTDASLNKYLESLEKEYVKQPVVYTACGYACSDHASWTAQGYKASFPFEGKMDWDWKVDPYIHTTNDTMDVLSFDHMADFAKLVLAFVVEAGEPK